MRIFAISDIHGCFDKLIEMLNKINFNPSSDKIIFLGDYVDRGPDSMKTLFFIDQLIELGSIALIGNHDEIFKEIIDTNYCNFALQERYYQKLGTDRTIREYLSLSQANKIKIRKILDKLQPYYEIGNYIFSHAGVNAEYPLDSNSLDDLTWVREEFYMNKAYDEKICIFGHTPTQNLNLNYDSIIWEDPIHKDKIGIDCGCVYNGKLACLEIPTMKKYYV